MNSAYCRFCLILALVSASWPAANPGWSQIVPDSSVNTVVTPTGTTFQIYGGTIAGTNLFHSFQEFSVPTGTAAFFNNPLSIENIITRVTGSKISNIDGILRANGNANLFLLNPNGIIFGPNARLNIGGSFLGTTAESIKFADGSEFSATDTASSPLLTVSVPVGLQFGPNPGSIIVQGIGHNIAQKGPFSLYLHSNHEGLQVEPGNTIALVGGDVTLKGGVLTAPGGRLELGSVRGGEVGLSATATGWVLDYSGILSFGDIQFSQRAIADASGSGSGSIQLQGRQITLSGGSAVFLDNQGNADSGDINVYASELLELNGFDPADNFRSSLAMQTTGTGAGGDIQVETQRLRLIDGGFLVALQANAIGGGALNINATESVVIDGMKSGDENILVTALGTTTLASGPAGSVTVTTPKFSLFNGGHIVASTTNSGAGGNLTVNAQAIEVIGASPQRNRVSIISASNLGSGVAGSITLNTQTLSVRDSGDISASSRSAGNAGQVIVNASEFVEVNGKLSDAPTPSRITSSVLIAIPFLRKLFNLPEVPSGNAGDVIINTPALRVSDGAIVGVRNEGIGEAGNLQINADSIRLDHGGSLTAATAQGEGGNILVNANDLVMRRGSSIVTNAGGSGNGGNMTLNIPVIAGLENSDIAANAIQGAGGNIQISTQGIFGLEFRPQPTSGSDITASSQFGVSGNVRITNPDVQPNAALVELPANLIDPNAQITSGCDLAANNHFIATGRGGLPPNPTQRLETEEHPWSDVRDLSAFRQPGTTASAPQASQPLVIEANTWKFNQQGQVEIYVSQAGTVNFLQPTCSES
jgi:filamentous hemagglutinin family protein